MLYGKADRAALICRSGFGSSATDKLAVIRAALCHNSDSAQQAVAHDTMNVICLGSRVIGPELALDQGIFPGPRFTGQAPHPAASED